MSSSEEYKRQIMNDLSQGNTLTMLRRIQGKNTNFDDFAQRSSHDERRQLFVALTSRPSPLARWSQNSKKRSPKLSQKNGMMWSRIFKQALKD